MKLNKKITLGVLSGFVIGCLFLVAIRFVSYKDDTVHHHANFELYVDGKRDEFKSFTFYEEVQACSSDAVNNPKIRVHMHNQENSVVHVHAPAVTWGHFFANLGYTLGGKVIKTDSGVYVDGENGKKLTFVLNGKDVTDISNKVIDSEDALLINYGDENSEALKVRYDSIDKSADEYNQRDDPSGCKGGSNATFMDKLKYSVGFTN